MSQGKPSLSRSGRLAERTSRGALNPRLLARALELAREMAGRGGGEGAETPNQAALAELEDLLRRAWEERVELTLKLVEQRKLNLKYLQQLRLGREIAYENGFYWLSPKGHGKGAREKPDGPLCPVCWEVEDKIVHLAKRAASSAKIKAQGQWQEWECRRCGEVFLERLVKPAGMETAGQRPGGPA